MVIVLSLYAVLVWVLFFKAKLLPWTRTWKWTVCSIGVLIAFVVIGALNFYTPSGRVAVQGATIEITPNVSGPVLSVDATPNQPLKAGDVIFRIDPAPFAAEVARLEAALSEARENVRSMHADLEAAEADIAAFDTQIAFAEGRVADIAELQRRDAATAFRLQEATTERDTLIAQRAAAIARARSLEIALSAMSGDAHVSVAQTSAQLARARWDLEQTEVKAPADGLATVLTLREGARVTSLRSAAAFIPTGDLALTGVFPQAGMSRIEKGADVSLAFAADPGRVYDSVILQVIPATGEGQISASGALPRAGDFLRGGGSDFVVRIAMPKDAPDRVRRLGVAGSATVFAEDTGPMEPLARILLWLRALTNFL